MVCSAREEGCVLWRLKRDELRMSDLAALTGVVGED